MIIQSFHHLKNCFTQIIRFIFILALFFLNHISFCQSDEFQQIIDELNEEIGELPPAEGPDCRYKYFFKTTDDNGGIQILIPHINKNDEKRQAVYDILDFNLASLDFSKIDSNRMEDTAYFELTFFTKQQLPEIKHRTVENGEIKHTTYEKSFSLGSWGHDKYFMNLNRIKDLLIDASILDLLKEPPNSHLIDEEGNEIYIFKEVENITNLEDTPEDSLVFTLVEDMPEFPGGVGALKKYIRDNLKHPDVKKSKQKHGKVFVNFIIEKDGKPSSPIILYSLGDQYDQEVIRLITEMPDWKPGFQNEKPVRVDVNLPIEF